MLKKLLKFSLYILYLLAIVLIFNYICYRIIRSRMPLDELPKSVQEGILRDLGWHSTDRNNSYIHFSKEKPRDVLRIACIGDSFTYGSEMKSGSDFPMQLQKIFNQSSNKKVEVINFGVGGYGAHQTYMVWDKIAKHYSPDVVVLGPLTESKLRDSSFNQVFTDAWDYNELDEYNRYLLGNIGGRYILNGDELKLISPIGKTLDSAMKKYLRFFPPWRYIRYDRRAPYFLTAPLLLFAPDKRLKNPFYYHADLELETEEIERRIVNKISDETPLLIHLIKAYDSEAFESVSKSNIIPVYVGLYGEKFYQAFWDHFSYSRNKLLASRLFDLVQNKDSTLPYHQIFETPILFDDSKVEKKSLNKFSDILFKIEGYELCRFYDSSFSFEDYCVGQLCESKVDQFSNVKSIFGIKSFSKSFLDTIFIPLPFELKEGMEIKLEVSGADNSFEKVIRRLTFQEELLNISLINVRSAWIAPFDYDKQRLMVNFSDEIKILDPGDVVTLSIDEKVILTHTFSKRKEAHLDFKSFNHRYMVIAASGHMNFDPFLSKENGTVDLVLKYNEEETRVAVAGWQKSQIKIKNPRLKN